MNNHKFIKKPVFSPVMASLGGGSSRGYGRGASAADGPVLSSIFGLSASSFQYNWSDNYTDINSRPDNGWGSIVGSQGHFLSYFQPTAYVPSNWVSAFNGPALMSNSTGDLQYIQNNVDAQFTFVSVSSSGAPYDIQQSIIYNPSSGRPGAGDGIWFEGADSRYATFETDTPGLGNATGFLAGHFEREGGYHKCLVIQITANGISRIFAPFHSINASVGFYNIYMFLPLNSTFTNMLDSRLNNATGNSLPVEYFEYYY